MAEIKSVQMSLPVWLHQKLKRYADWNGLPVEVTARLLVQQQIDGKPSVLSKPLTEKKSKPAQPLQQGQQSAGSQDSAAGGEGESKDSLPTWGPLRFHGSCKGCGVALKKGDRGLAKQGMGAIGACCEAKADDFLAGKLTA